MGYDGNNETLYIKLDRSALRYEADFYIKDLGGIECSNSDILARVKAHAVYHFKHPGNMPVSITKVVEEIHSLYPKLTVVSLGETDVIMEYRSKEPEPFMQVAKTGFLCVLLFVGAAFAIMAFHNDISITELFDRFYLQVMGSEKPAVSPLEIAYSIGLAVGILFFYNHFGKKKLTHDPTPIQVEMRKYEKDLDTAIIENGARRGENLDVS